MSEPAFPTTIWEEVAPGCEEASPHPGMSLRDWFAGQALTAFIGAHGVSALRQAEQEGGSVSVLVAEACYQVADAMMLVRARKDDVDA